MFANLRGDIAYAARVLARSPGFTAAAVGALALAIGANATVFTLANAFLFKNLPFDDSARVVYLSATNPQRPGTRGVSYPDHLDYRDQVTAFEGAGVLTTGSVDVSDKAGLPERYRCAYLSAGAFATIGQRPVLGRDFTPEDQQPGTPPGTPPAVILGDAIWRGRYGGDPSIVGRTIRINDVQATIVGVMRPGLTFPGTSDLWLPLVRTDATNRRDARTLTMFARLAPGVSLGAARGEAAVVASRLASAYPASNRDIGVLVQNFNDRFNSNDTARLLSLLLWAVGFVLLIACANVANLLLGRAIERSREIAIRTSLGANRWHVVRQLLVESLMLAGLGGALGVVLGSWGVRLFDRALAPTVKPAYIDFAVDARVILYLVLITLATGICFGLAPALQLSKVDVSAMLKDGGGVAGQSRRARALSTLLIVAEVALAVVLLAGAGMMIRSFLNTTRADIGISPDNILSFSVNLRRTKYPRVEDQYRFYDRLTERVEALPGVDTLALASDLPAESPDEFSYEIEGAAPLAERAQPRAMGLLVGEDYFKALGLRPRAGREFAATDTPSTPPLAIVNETFAKTAWRGQDALGKRVRLLERPDGAPRSAPLIAGPWLTIAAVVPDVLQDDESFEVSPVIYLSGRQRQQGGMEILVRTRVPPATVAEAIRREVQALDADLAVRAMRPLEESLWLRNWRYRVFGSMFAIFAAIALALAAVGLYAVTAHSVSQRTREIGVRMAIGASQASVASMIVREIVTVVAIGCVMGAAGALALARFVESLLVGLEPHDPVTLLGAALLLIVVTLVAGYLPARRAARIDPIRALRAE